MQVDFEPILERQVHHFLNGASGLWHMGQRDIVWTRISKEAFDRGLRLRHYGEILHAKILAEYGSIVDKVKITLFTELDEVERRQEIARVVYDQRNRRLEAMTDESVDTFYSCLLCQSFAPNHVCIITPERLGLCGAYNWLDGHAAYEIDPTGANQPVPKGECLDPKRGIWQGRRRLRLRQQPQDPRVLCGLLDHGPADDQLRLLRGDLRLCPRVQRRHGGQPRVPGRHPGGDELLDPGGRGRRRPADAGLHGLRQDLPHQPQVPGRRRRPRASDLDAEGAQGAARR